MDGERVRQLMASTGEITNQYTQNQILTIKFVFIQIRRPSYCHSSGRDTMRTINKAYIMPHIPIGLNKFGCSILRRNSNIPVC